MLFNSAEFLLFSLVVFPTYFLLPAKLRWILLLAASVFFYGYWKVEYLGLIFISALTDYYCSRKMGQVTDKKVRKPYLWLSLSVNLGLLGIFKYYNFFLDSLHQAIPLNTGFSSLDLILPMGISFYTFQTLAYTIDVYRDRIVPEKNFGMFSLYVTFFPQLVAGPIERASHLLPQLKSTHSFSSSRLFFGFRLILWGLFKKVVVADRLATFVDPVYAATDQYNGMILLLATVMFAIQIYCDFSGYSDMAIGLAKILGIDLMKNFRVPYFASSIGEFWNRWHISLSTWFRDYVYIPLGGNRVSKFRWNLNLLIVFLVSGLWHGANWTFIVWGGLHGSYLILENFIKPATKTLKKWAMFRPISILSCFVLVLIGWVFFRASDISNALFILNEIKGISLAEVKDLGWTMKQFVGLSISSFQEPVSIQAIRIPFSLGQLALALGFSFITIVGEQVYETNLFSVKRVLALPIPYALIITTLLTCVVLFGFFDSNEFIYFQF